MKLRNAHLAAVERHKIVDYGEKYVVEGWLSAHTEESRQRLVRTIWIIDRGHEAPRLVTAYPGKE